jgi:IS30 family transposase
VNINWSDAKMQLGSLTDEEQRIVDLLTQRKTQPEIAEALGQHRSRIWRKIRRLKTRLRQSTQTDS